MHLFWRGRPSLKGKPSLATGFGTTVRLVVQTCKIGNLVQINPTNKSHLFHNLTLVERLKEIFTLSFPNQLPQLFLRDG